MIYFVNFMSSLYHSKTDIYDDIIKSHIENIDIEYKEYFINVTIIEGKITPLILKDKNKNVISTLQFDFENDNTFVIGNKFTVAEVLEIFSKAKTTIKKSIPDNYLDIYKVIEPREIDEDINILPDTLDNIISEYKKVKKHPNFVLFVEKTLMPQDIEFVKNNVECKVEILNLIRQPMIDYMTNRFNLEEEDGYAGVEYYDSSSINVMNLAMIYSKYFPKMTNTVRYEDYLLATELNLKSVTVKSSSLEQYNSYMSVVEAMRDFDIENDPHRIKKMKK